MQKLCEIWFNTHGKAIAQTKVFDKNDALWKLKAYNGRVVCAWLAHATLKLARAAPSPERLILADCMSPPEIFFETILKLQIPSNSTGPHWAFFCRSVNWGPNFQSAALTGFHCTQVRCKPGAIEGRKCWPVFATCFNKTLVKLCGNHAWRDQIWCWSRSRAEAVDIRDTGFKYLRCKKMLAGLAMRTRGSSIQFQKIMRGNFIRIHNIDRFHEHAFLWTIKNSQEEPIAVVSNPKSTCDLASEI